jgi:hypothetical protein
MTNLQNTGHTSFTIDKTNAIYFILGTRGMWLLPHQCSSTVQLACN